MCTICNTEVTDETVGGVDLCAGCASCFRKWVSRKRCVWSGCLTDLTMVDEYNSEHPKHSRYGQDDIAYAKEGNNETVNAILKHADGIMAGVFSVDMDDPYEGGIEYDVTILRSVYMRDEEELIPEYIAHVLANPPEYLKEGRRNLRGMKRP